MIRLGLTQNNKFKNYCYVVSNNTAIPTSLAVPDEVTIGVLFPFCGEFVTGYN